MKKLLIGILMVFSMLIYVPGVADAKTNEEVAKEIMYGQWAPYQADFVKFNFSNSNLSIDSVSEADPYGKTIAWCYITINGIKYYTEVTITLNGDKYNMTLNYTGTAYQLKQLDSSYKNRKFVKVYW